MLVESLEYGDRTSRGEWWELYIRALQIRDALPPGYVGPHQVLTSGQFAAMLRAYYEFELETL